LNTDSERILLNEIKLNPQRFGALYDEYYEPIFSYIFRRLGNYELTRDIASDTFMKAYLKIHAFEWKGVSIAYWFFRIATNEINLYFRSNKYTSQFLQNAIDKNAFDFVHAPAEEEREIIENELKRHEEFIAVQTAEKIFKGLFYITGIAGYYFVGSRL